MNKEPRMPNLIGTRGLSSNVISFCRNPYKILLEICTTNQGTICRRQQLIEIIGSCHQHPDLIMTYIFVQSCIKSGVSCTITVTNSLQVSLLEWLESQTWLQFFEWSGIHQTVIVVPCSKKKSNKPNEISLRTRK